MKVIVLLLVMLICTDALTPVFVSRHIRNKDGGYRKGRAGRQHKVHPWQKAEMETKRLAALAKANQGKIDNDGPLDSLGHIIGFHPHDETIELADGTKMKESDYRTYVIDKNGGYGHAIHVDDHHDGVELNEKPYKAILFCFLGFFFFSMQMRATNPKFSMKATCITWETFTLGFGKDVFFSVNSAYRFFGPFANEIGNVVSLTLPLNWYPHHPNTDIKLVEKTAIDAAALGGIVANVAYYAEMTGHFKVGMLKGYLLLFFTFCMPNVIMDKLLHVEKRPDYGQFFKGLFIIYLLDLAVNFLWCQAVGGDVHRWEHLNNHGATKESMANGQPDKPGNELVDHHDPYPRPEVFKAIEEQLDKLYGLNSVLNGDLATLNGGMSSGHGDTDAHAATPVATTSDHVTDASAAISDHIGTAFSTGGDALSDALASAVGAMTPPADATATATDDHH